MCNKFPIVDDQIVDPITHVVYPPPEAIVPQLNTIRQVALATIKLYEQTHEIKTTFANLDMIQRAIDYLRGAPLMDEMKPLPEDKLNPVYIPSSEGLTITSRLNKDGEYNVTIVGTGVESNILYPDVFGELEIPVVEMGIEIPVICGDTYRVIQENKILRIYEDDPFISYDEEMDLWIKDKEYVMDEDFFKYLFLLDKGRSKIKISFQNLKTGEETIFNILSHIHFKPKQEEEEPIEPPEENPTPEDPENPEEPKEPDENEDEDSNG